MKAPSESAILRGCLDLLRLRKVFHFRYNQGAIPTGKGGYRKFRGMPGVSDILAVLPDGSGRLFAIEVKRHGGRLSAHQQAFLDLVNQANGYGVVVYSVAELESVLSDLGVPK